MKNHSAPVYTFQQFNDELNDFYKFLKDNKYTDEEIRKIFAPLKPDTKKLKLTAAIVLSIVSIFTILYLATYIETISWHFSAIGRIFLIKLLPYWDWTTLKNQRCLIEKFTSSTIEETSTFNCDLCENIQNIDVFDHISSDVLKERYLDIDVPVIVKKSWVKDRNFMDELLQNDEIANSKPCSLSTNIHNGVTSIRNLLLKTQAFDSFFLNFQNCDFRAMKQFRGFAPRPSFLPPELSPVQYNWLLWSKNYNVTQFKTVTLVDKVTVVGQIFGGNFVSLVPRKNCEGECPTIEVILKEGESIIFTNLWNLEYRPEMEENLAVILELH